MKITPVDVLVVGYKYIGKKNNGNLLYSKLDERDSRVLMVQEFLPCNSHFSFYILEKEVAELLVNFYK